jgi:hypothetical protein
MRRRTEGGSSSNRGLIASLQMALVRPLSSDPARMSGKISKYKCDIGEIKIR